MWVRCVLSVASLLILEAFALGSKFKSSMECIKTQHHESRIIFQAFALRLSVLFKVKFERININKVTTVWKICKVLVFATNDYLVYNVNNFKIGN